MSKLPNVVASVFSTMSQLASEYKAINLSQGFPDFSVDKRLIEITENVLQESVHQYMPMAGYEPLLQQIATLTKKQYNRIVQVSTEILVTAGATQGIYTTLQALLSTGDEVIVLDPSYDSYEPSIIMSGGIAIRIPINNDYTVNWTVVDQACSFKTRMIIINNPHNPTGRIFTQADIEALEKILEKYPNILLLSDEVYEYITFEQKHISINTREKLIAKSIIISSFGKSFHITGWKVGYLIAPKNLMIEIKKVHQFMVFSVNSISQVAISRYLEVVTLEDIAPFYQKKREYFNNLLSTSRFKLLPCEGTYFQVASYAAISEKSDVDFCKWLTIEHGVAAIPNSAFYANGKDQKLIRFCFAKRDITLAAAAEKLISL
ncbi:methionine aminotransferase [Flavobacterium algicola]|uniref:methionine aminotransferase n=1 Tax=Flavobacterium algicola TaxID=556529 RepID=UPI001EFD48A2|nr:methionine aminotransferase [Flavobacterium algicola]MCG9793195.1 methionine aminotransferase [Flavobacterium algicola]